MPGNELVQSLVRGLEILQLAGNSEHGIRVTDAAEVLGVKFPTAHNLIRTLAAKGFLRKTDSNCYIPGTALLELADSSSNKLKYSEMSNLMLKISKDIPDAVIVYAEESCGTIFSKLRIHPENPGIVQKPNAQMKLYSTSSGLAYMAFGSPDVKEELIQGAPFHEEGIHLWKSFSKLEKFLADSVKKSYVSPDFEGAARRPFSVPIYSANNILQGIIGVTIDIDKNIEKRISEISSYLKNIAKIN